MKNNCSVCGGSGKTYDLCSAYPCEACSKQDPILKSPGEADYGVTPLGPTQQACVAGPKIPTVSEQAEAARQRMDDTFDAILREAIVRAEDHGYQVGFDAAAESIQETITRLHESKADLIAERDDLRRRVENQAQTIAQYREWANAVVALNPRGTFPSLY